MNHDTSPPPTSESQLNRRTFLKTSSAAVLATPLLGGLTIERAAFAASSDTLKIALVGCGGRGTGAANQALTAPGSTKLVAMADVRPEQLEKSLSTLKEKKPDRIDVPADHQFTDFDGYQKAIALADVVILATSPGFRPIHFEEAVRQGKHVFMEKPVATDAPGIRRVLAAAAEAKKKNLKVGVGLQRRHKANYVELVKRIQDGALGDLQVLRCYWNGGSRDGVERLPNEKEMHYQIRNWYYFTWLSGDHIVEQHVHNIDVCNWVKGAHPVRAQGSKFSTITSSNSNTPTAPECSANAARSLAARPTSPSMCWARRAKLISITIATSSASKAPIRGAIPGNKR